MPDPSLRRMVTPGAKGAVPAFLTAAGAICGGAV